MHKKISNRFDHDCEEVLPARIGLMFFGKCNQNDYASYEYDFAYLGQVTLMMKRILYTE